MSNCPEALAWGCFCYEAYMNGWIKLHRQVKDNSFCYRDMERFGFWAFLLLSANHTQQEFYLGRTKIICNPGQIVTGRESLSAQTGLHPSKIQRYLTLLEKEGQIEQQMNSKYRIITLKNWIAYQDIEPQVNRRRTAGEPQVNTNKKEKNVKNDKNVPTEHGNADVNKIIECMEECFGTLDGTKGRNRQYAWLLLKKSGMNLGACIALARGASQHNWWKSRITKVEALYKNAHLITNALKESSISTTLHL